MPKEGERQGLRVTFSRAARDDFLFNISIFLTGDGTIAVWAHQQRTALKKGGGGLVNLPLPSSLAIFFLCPICLSFEILDKEEGSGWAALSFVI